MSCDGLNGNDAGQTGHVYELDRQTCKKWFGHEGRFGRVGTIGEGSCFFHSVAFALNRDNYSKLDDDAKKKMVYAWRKSFADSFTQQDHDLLRIRKKYDLVKKRMEMPTEWADESIIRYVAHKLNMNIIFMDMRTKTAFCGIHNEAVLYGSGDKSIPTVLVAWVNRQHFESIVRIDGPTTLRTLFSETDAHDRSMIQHLMQTYSDACGL